jgi:hypothetical protein
MKKKIAYLSTIIVIFSLYSCMKVIDLPLNTSSSQIVVIGNVYDQVGPDTIKISKSVKFSESNVYPMVVGARVIISSNTGESELLTEIAPGIYVTSTLQGIAGRTYTLTIVTGGKTYTASSTIPAAVNIDSVYLKNGSDYGSNKDVHIKFQDPANVTNYYRVIEFINNVRLSLFDVEDDKLSNGTIIDHSIIVTDTIYKAGDKIDVWLESVDENAYEYFRTARVEDRNSSTPANPVSNLNNGVLGYFNACSVRKITMVVQ